MLKFQLLNTNKKSIKQVKSILKANKIDFQFSFKGKNEYVNIYNDKIHIKEFYELFEHYNITAFID